MEPAEFAAEYWGRRPLHSPADRPGAHPDGFTDLLSPAAVDELLSRRGLRTPFIRMARDGRVVDAGRYTRPGGAGALVGDQVADDRVLELFADGHTIVLQGLHRLWPPLVELAGQLTTETGHPVQVNAYVTPASSTGFSAHYDVHDVFVLQVAGTKRWRIHEPVRPDPLRDEPWTDRRDAVTARAAEPPLLETVLGPGDALYLPRGYLHAAEALGEVSIHLTVGVQPVTREAIVQALAELAADDPALRASLPLGVDVGEPAAVAADVTATVQALVRRLQSATPEEVARRLATRLAGSHRPAPLAPLAQAAALAGLGPGTVLAPRRHLRHATWHEADELVLLAADRTLRLPVTTAKAVHALLTDGPLRVDELPGLGPEDALALARRLVREGVAVPVDAGE